MLKRELPRLLLATQIALVTALPAFGFGGHPPVPPPLPLVPPVDVIPDPPPTGTEGPIGEIDPIPPVLLEPTVDDLPPPVFTDDGGNPTPPPDTNTPNETPEPATVMMALLGAGLAGAWARRKNRHD